LAYLLFEEAYTLRLVASDHNDLSVVNLFIDQMLDEWYFEFEKLNIREMRRNPQAEKNSHHLELTLAYAVSIDDNLGGCSLVDGRVTINASLNDLANHTDLLFTS
jgi:hypothetical protein